MVKAASAVLEPIRQPHPPGGGAPIAPGDGWMILKVETAPGSGTAVRLAKTLPRRAPVVGQTKLKRIAAAIAAEAPADLIEEIRRSSTVKIGICPA